MIAIIDYDCGNTGSIKSMLRYLGVEACVTRDPSEIRAATGIVLPGVGSFDKGAENLSRFGLEEVLSSCVIDRGVPILGICLGAQLMTNGSEEGLRPGFGWVDIDTRRFSFASAEERLPVPHMGWSAVDFRGDDCLFSGFEGQARFYFVHSYHFVCADPVVSLCECEYGYRFVAAFRKGNIVGVQFHPEKSHRYGVALFSNFLRLCGKAPHA